ncbi:dihydrodipicolinate reductase [Octadecabacter sp. G9-8]|uniref:Dihydrodipicolinate reductase n=1 Tax=Octadecabacter dasysiphoniae TaxID=2909341 RepID=A0ABS9CWX3_9RHOB|nr:dihydrodipicolinate reductase [Octadecabacter dasysiphoniae]MCF2871282.1 dihydrodipicolinate reductase [Octadecabacter dasysiphoniae]
MFRAFSLITTLLVALPASAQAYERISDRATFVDTVGGKDLKIALYGLTLNVRDNGTITGRAAGWDIVGSWTWEDGYFCRDMDWSGYPIEYNCQLVEVNGDRIRFTVDQGTGDDAVLRIR